jgi:hypothetical protein
VKEPGSKWKPAILSSSSPHTNQIAPQLDEHLASPEPPRPAALGHRQIARQRDGRRPAGVPAIAAWDIDIVKGRATVLLDGQAATKFSGGPASEAVFVQLPFFEPGWRYAFARNNSLRSSMTNAPPVLPRDA